MPHGLNLEAKKGEPKRKSKIKSRKFARRKHKIPHSKERQDIGPLDLEQILVDRLSQNKSELKISRKALFIPEIIYSSTPSLKELAHSNGFSLGRLLYERSDKTMDSLLFTLEQAGMGKVLYHSSDNSATITAKPKIPEPNVKENVHIYESGIISGFIAAATNLVMNVTETHCVYNGNEMCRFVIHGMEEYNQNDASIDPQEMLEAISKSIFSKVPDSKISEEYYLSYMTPLTSSPLCDEVSRIMYVAGKSLASRSVPINKNLMEMIKISFGLKNAKVIGRNKFGPTRLMIEYAPLNSNSQFLSISQSFLHGLLDNRKNVQVSSAVGMGKRSNYILYISVNSIK